MHIKILGLNIDSNDVIAKIKADAVAAGGTVIHAEESNVSALWTEFKGKFPDIVTAMQKTSADLVDKTMSGGDKAVAVAVDAIPLVTGALAALPDLKAFLVHGATELFAEGVANLEAAAGSLLGKL